jgi:hypothetical protein
MAIAMLATATQHAAFPLALCNKQAYKRKATPYLFIVTSAQLRSRCGVWLVLRASLQTVHHVLHAAFYTGAASK